MKSIFVISFLFLFMSADFAQNSKFEIPVRQTPKVKQESLTEAKWITDLSPKLWSSMSLSSNDRYFLDQRRENEFPEPPGYVYPQEKYKHTIAYVSVQIAASCNHKISTALSTSDKLTDEQKNILNTVDPGTDIIVTIKYKYKDQNMDSYGLRNNTVEGVCLVTVVPETEAEFPGGWKQLSNYFVQNVVDKISDKKVADIALQAVIEFTVTEEGEIVNAKIAQTSSYSKIDQQILEVVNNMPKWIPAADSKGTKVKQHFKIPFSVGC